jgi:hypothetical protein
MLELEIGRDARLQAQIAQLQQEKARLQVCPRSAMSRAGALTV